MYFGESEDDGSSNSGSSEGHSCEWLDEFEDFCLSDDLSIDELRMRTEGISLADLLQYESEFLHRVCINENVTLEIMEYLLELYPSAINYERGISDEDIAVDAAYPLHLACLNEDCSNEVIQLLITKSEGQILRKMAHMNFDWGHMQYFHQYGGTPLHHYLARNDSDVDLDIVKQLAPNPDLLLACDETRCMPMHILQSNKNIGDMFDVVKYLAELNPSSLLGRDDVGQVPLHFACSNGHITARTVQILLQVCPESANCSDDNKLPIHILCEGYHGDMDDEVAKDILRLLLEVHPNSVSTQSGEGHDDDDGELPLHIAATNKSPGFCKLLVDAYPESVRIKNRSPASLPFHKVCQGCYGKSGRHDTAEYLFSLYPEALHIRNNNGYLPIHTAVISPENHSDKVVDFLVHRDPECVSKPVENQVDNQHAYRGMNGALPLHIVCSGWDRSNVTELLFDLYPEAILIRNGQGKLPIDIIRENHESMPVNEETGKLCNEEYGEKNEELIAFLSDQMIYAIKAQDGNAMRTPDNTGSLPLHIALRLGAPLGSIKLLVKGYPDAINLPDGSGVHPLDIACQFSIVDVVKYLAELSPGRLKTCDVNKNFPLHFACRGGNCKVITHLLETPMSSASVSERNVDDMLPIHLFCEFVKRRWCEGETPEYTEIIWRLLTAYPETLLNW